MPTQQQQPPIVVDYDQAPEILCEGPTNIHGLGALAIITFTHLRPTPAELFGGTVNVQQVVRARITMSMPNAVALRDLLNRVIKDDPAQVPSGGASSDTLH